MQRRVNKYLIYLLTYRQGTVEFREPLISSGTLVKKTLSSCYQNACIDNQFQHGN